MDRYIIDTSKGVVIQHFVKMGGKVIRTYEGVIYRENFKISPFGKIIEKFLFQKKYKDEKKQLS